MRTLSIDVGGTFVKWGIVDENNELIQKGRLSTPKESLTEFLTTIQKIYHEQSSEEITGIGFSIPGILDSRTGDILHGGSIRYFDGINFLEELASFPCKITVENDARCALIAEKELGSLRNVKNGLVYVLGTGLGGAILINGEVYRGTNLYAGELSFIRSHDQGERKFLGLELGVPALVEKIRKALSLTELSGEGMIDLVTFSQPVATRLVNEYVEKLVDSLVSLQFLFSPEKIAIGGGISRNELFITLVKDRFCQEINTSPIPVAIPSTVLTACEFYSDANLLGAALVNKQRIFS